MIDYFLFAAAFNGLFIAVLLFRKMPPAYHDKVLAIWLICMSIYIGIYIFGAPYFFSQYPLITNSFIYLLTLQGPFLYLYVTSLVSGRKRINFGCIVHLIPLLLCNICLVITYLINKDPDVISLDHVARNSVPSAFILLSILFVTLSGAVYFIMTLRLLNKHNIHIFNNFSSSETIDLYWLQRLIAVFGVSWIVMVVIIVIHHIFHFFTMRFCTDGLFLLLSLFILFLGYYGIKQKEIYPEDASGKMDDSIPDSETSRPKYAGSTMQDGDIERYSIILKDYMISHKPFLNPNLTLKQLSDATGISTQNLSQVINEIYENNFFNFINQYRVEDFKVRIADPKYANFSILGVAFESGFNSKTSFNRIFKNLTSQTPSDYRKSIIPD